MTLSEKICFQMIPSDGLARLLMQSYTFVPIQFDILSNHRVNIER